ncbi:LysR family transcriptional regulator [Nocardia seriolae]|uniref:LysR family transcriptional regulator n=1 Tax=Nocardia seriolae TaxID=37332 RepID=A0ABC9Z7T8_9NOCA|nr:hypothetical protein NSERKGN1266_62570 [Nocardia seriolae]BEK93865.1 hypothetical protein NSER024013_17710 [Nocardia seriolae]GAP33528.1 LysR family transcriptional regulator [Nocardia seriolae]
MSVAPGALVGNDIRIARYSPHAVEAPIRFDHEPAGFVAFRSRSRLAVAIYATAAQIDESVLAAGFALVLDAAFDVPHTI